MWLSDQAVLLTAKADTVTALATGRAPLLAWQDGRVVAIRDFRYVPYIAAEAELVEV
jgi:hypothetical protein